MTLDEFFAEAKRIGLTAEVFAAQLAARPEFADCAPLATKEGAAEPVSEHKFVQPVPDHCDRITWRGAYYHLHETTPPAVMPAEPSDAASPHKPAVQRIMDLARSFRAAPGDLYDRAYKALESEAYAALSQTMQLEAGRKTWSADAAPSAAIAAREQSPDDSLLVARITLNGATLSVEPHQMAEMFGTDDEQHTYELTFKRMTRAAYEALGEFNGF